MAGESGKRSSRADKKEPSPFALLPLGKHTGKPAISISRPVIVIGSRESCRIHLSSTSVSQQHALLVLNNGTYYVHDLASRNHVIVNGKRVLDRDLSNGDELRIGSFILKFIAPASTQPVKPPAPAAALIVPDQSRPAALTKRVFIIGRRGGSDILLADASVSTMHAVVFEQDGQRVVRDLGSRTGTWVNGVQVHQHVLNAGDQIKIGPSTFTFQLTDRLPAVDEEPAVAASPVTVPAAALPTAELPARESTATESPAAEPADLGLDFGLDFSEPEPAAADVEASAVSSPSEDATDSSSAARRGWRAVVPEPIEPTIVETPAEPSAEQSVENTATISGDVSTDSEVPLEICGPFATGDDSSGTATIEPLDFSDATETATTSEVVPFDLSADDLGDDRAEDLAEDLAENLAENLIDENEKAEAAAKAAAAKHAAEQAAASVAAAEHERLEAARVAAEEAERQRIEAARVEAERIEAERNAAAQAERERVDAERLAAEEAERQRAEAARIEAERAEAARVEAARVEAERLEAERAEASRIEAERLEAERLAEEKLAAEQAERERIEAEQRAAEEAERQRIEAERIEAERVEAERVEAERLEAERLEAERVESERIEAERIAFENAAVEVNQRLADEQVQAQRAAAALAFEHLEDDGETVDATSPSPDSALAFDLDAEPAHAAPAFGETADAHDPASLDETLSLDEPTGEVVGESISDSAFGLAVNEFAGESGSIIEPVATTPSPQAPVTSDDTAAAHGLLESPFGGLDQHATIAPSTEAHEGLEFLDSDETETGQDVLDDLSSFSSESSIDVFGPESEATPLNDESGSAAVLDEAPVEPPAAPSLDVPQSEPASAPKAREVTPEERGQFWANTETMLGGMPLILPPERKEPLFADGRTLEPPSLDEDEEIDSVSDLIGNLLDEAPKPAVPPPTTSPAITSPAVTSPASAPGLETPSSKTGAAETPKQTRRPLLGRRGADSETTEIRSNRLDEQIPPFEALAPRSIGDRGRRDDLLRLESLSRPPVTETDVFAHGSMPSNELALPDELLDDPLSPRGRSRTLPVAPVDLLGDVSAGTNGRRNRPAFGGPARNGNPAIGRIDLPTDPFWSNPGNGVGTGNGKKNGMSPATGAMLSAKNDFEFDDSLDGENAAGNGNGYDDPHSADEEIGEAGDASLGEIARRLEPANRSLKNAGNPQFSYAADFDPVVLRRLRRQRFRRVSGLLIGGTVLAVGTFVGCMKFIPVRSQVEMHLSYKHMAESEAQRRQFVAGQTDLLHNDSTRLTALRSKLPPNVSSGFLDDQTEYGHIADAMSWTPLQPNQLTISFDTTDPEGDTQRIKAVAEALYDANGVLLDDAARSRERLADAIDEQNNTIRRVDDLQKSIEQNRAIAEARPSVEKINQLAATADKLSKAWKDSEIALKAAQADVERLKAQNAPASTAQPNDAVGSANSDANLAQMQSDLAAAQKKLDDAKAARDQQAAQAKADLDAALSQFQQQVAAAQDLSRDNPQLSGYVASAQKLQETTHKLVDDLISRQQENYNNLTDLQARLGQKMQARREEMWQSDEKLKNLNDQLEYAKRQYNTAIGTGDQKAAADLKAQIDLLESVIKSREDMLPDDPFYSDAVAALQKIVDQTKQQMKEDRQHSDEALDALQKSFASNQPAMDNLPAQQKMLATALEKRLSDLNAARAKFNDVATAEPSDDATRKLQDQVSQLTVAISTRKKQVADQSAAAMQSQADAKSKADLDAREAELPRLIQAAADAQKASFAADAELQNARHAVDQASAAADTASSLINEQISVKAQLEQLRAAVNSRQDDVRMSIEPVRVADSDIKRQMGQDNRILYGSASSATILLIASVLILMTIHAANQEMPLNAMEPTNEKVDPFWQAAAAEAKVHPEITTVEPFPGANDVVIEAADAEPVESNPSEDTAAGDAVKDEDAVAETSA